MYPRDNIFNIYYNIGRRVPFQVKRSRSMNAEYRHSKEGKTFMVERVMPRGKYGEAYGYCLINNIRNDEYIRSIQTIMVRFRVPDVGNGHLLMSQVLIWTIFSLFTRLTRLSLLVCIKAKPTPRYIRKTPGTFIGFSRATPTIKLTSQRLRASLWTTNMSRINFVKRLIEYFLR